MISRRSILTAPLALLAAEPPVRIQYDGSAFRVVGWAAKPADLATAQSLLKVYAGAAADLPPMLGSYFVEDGVLGFKPRFPLGPGVRARAVFQATGIPVVQAEFHAPARVIRSTTRVSQVYPSAAVLPANLLKFYVQFTAPMRRGEAWDRIRLLDHRDTTVDLAFLELEEELWDASGSRLTILFDPGRIKRGVLPREEVGSGLVEGRQYTLVIDRDWQDETGAPLTEPYRKQFRVGPEARAGIDLKQWSIQAPRIGSMDSLRVRFPAPLDYALLQRLLWTNHGNRSVPGTTTIGDEEKLWVFHPASPWSAGDYSLRVDSALEDVAGNRVGRPFDVDTFDPVTVQLARKFESIPFRLQ